MPSSNQGHSPTALALAFATVLRDMFLQPCNGHRHPHRQLPLFARLQFTEPYQPPHSVARLDELAFEPSMFRTSYRQARSRIHLAPVENREPQLTTKAKQKQTLFFALSSPCPAVPQVKVQCSDGFMTIRAVFDNGPPNANLFPSQKSSPIMERSSHASIQTDGPGLAAPCQFRSLVARDAQMTRLGNVTRPSASVCRLSTHGARSIPK